MKLNFVLIFAVCSLLVSCGKNQDSSSGSGYPPATPYSLYGDYTGAVPTEEYVQQNESYMSPYKPFYNSNTPLRDRLHGRIVGAHQGGSISLKANTINRFEWARGLGVDIVEMDLRLTKDGVAIVFHDEELNLTTNCKGKVAEKNWSEIQKCRRFYLYEINSFEEVLQWNQGRVVINAEFKSLDVIIPAINLIRQYNAKNWVFFQAKGDKERYNIARGYDHDVALLFVVDNMDAMNWVLNLNDDNLVVVEVHEESRTKEIIDAAHRGNKLVLEDSWHFSSTRELFGASCTPLYKANIDIAITDRPNSCLQQRDNF
jgi:glycerophosphoryl diester phosphodiesterase